MSTNRGKKTSQAAPPSQVGTPPAENCQRQSAPPADIGEEIRRLQCIQSALTAIYIAINEGGDFDAADALSVTFVHIEATLLALDQLDSAMTQGSLVSRI